MRKIRLRMAILLGLTVLSSCAALQITTWIVKQGELVHGADRKHIIEAEGYRCYSLSDDMAWREELKLERQCCQGAGSARGL